MVGWFIGWLDDLFVCWTIVYLLHELIGLLLG
jgi:uncharacterized membrane protein YkvA (DUF1232 family)